MYLQPGQQPKRFAEVLGEGFSSINDILNKARQAAMEREKQRQMMEYHKQDMELRKQLGAQAHALDPFRQKLLEAQTTHQRQLSDPNFKAKQFQALLGHLAQNGFPGASQANQTPQDEQENTNGPSMQMGQGQGMMAPADQQIVPEQQPQGNLSEASQSGQQQGGIDFNDPNARLAFQMTYGHDLPAPRQTPEQKQAMSLETSQKKLDQKTAVDSTNATKTKNINILNGVKNSLPILDNIIQETKKGDVPGQLLGKYFSPNKQANYESEVSQGSETFANAFGYPNTDAGYRQAEKVVARRNAETDVNYIKRLEKLKDEIKLRSNNASEFLNKEKRYSKEDPLGIR